MAAGAGIEQECEDSRGRQGLLTRVAPKRALHRVFGNGGEGGGRPPKGDGLSLARLACCALLPSVALSGFASAAAAARGAEGAAAALSPVLTNRWWVTVKNMLSCELWLSLIHI